MATAEVWLRLLRITFVICLVVILTLAWMPAQDAIGSDIDVVNHTFAFFTLCVLFRLGWINTPLPALLISLLALGGLIEIVQSFVGRDAAWHDIGADVLGLLLGAIFLQIFHARLIRLLR